MIKSMGILTDFIPNHTICCNIHSFLGPRLFLSCPMDVSKSQVWFTDLWNYSIVPYLLEAIREGLQLYGRRAPWEDPVDYVIQSYPWPDRDNQEQLLRLRPEDVGYDTQGSAANSTKSTAPGVQQSDSEGDPLVIISLPLTVFLLILTFAKLANY